MRTELQIYEVTIREPPWFPDAREYALLVRERSIGEARRRAWRRLRRKFRGILTVDKAPATKNGWLWCGTRRVGR